MKALRALLVALAFVALAVSPSFAAWWTNSTATVVTVSGDPTGTNPSTTGFQAAVTAACTGGANGAVYIPAGLWQVGPITGVNGSCTIYGAGHATKLEPDTAITWAADQPIFLLGNGATNIRFTSMDFVDPNAITGGPIMAVKGFLNQQVTIDNVYVFSTLNQYDFGFLFDGITHLRYSGDYVFNVRNTAYFTNTTTGPVFDVTWDGLSTADTTGLESAGRTFNDGVENSTTTLTSATAAFVAGDVNRPISGPNIPANTYVLSVTNGTTIVMSNAATGTASGLTITLGQVASSGGNGFYCQNSNTNGCVNVRVLGVHATGIFDTGIEIGSGGGTTANASVTVNGAVVLNNTFGKAGILCRDCINGVMSNNTVSIHGAASTSAGIFAWASETPMSDIVISGNTIIQPSGGNSHGNCIAATSTSATNKTNRVSIQNNDCIPGTGVDTNGILISGFDNQATISGNVVHMPAANQSAMNINCSQANCTDLVISGNELDGGFNDLQMSNVTHSQVTGNLLSNGNGGQKALLASGTLTGSIFAPNNYHNDAGGTYGGPLPTVGTCGTSPTQPVAPSSNQAGCATAGSATTVCTVTFNPTLDNIPLTVQLTDMTTAAALRPSSVTASSFIVNNLTASDQFCWSLPNGSN